MDDLAARIYAEELLPQGLGYPLWVPEPLPPSGEINIGDVGYLRQNGRYFTLFNVRSPAGADVNARGVPEGYYPLAFDSTEFIDSVDVYLPKGLLCSKSVSRTDTGIEAGVSGAALDAMGSISFQCERRRGALVLLDGHGAKSIILSENKNIVNYIAKNIASWHKHALDRGHVVELEDITMVYGTVKASQWIIAAFMDETKDQSFTLKVQGGTVGSAGASYKRIVASSVSVRHRSMPRVLETSDPDANTLGHWHAESGSNGSNTSSAFKIPGVKLQSGTPEDARSTFDGPEYAQPSPGVDFPSNSDAPESLPCSHCIFVGRYKVKRRRMPSKIPKVIRAQGQPNDDPAPGGEGHHEGIRIADAYDSESENESEAGVKSNLVMDPIDGLLQYILENSTCEVAVGSDRDIKELHNLGIDVCVNPFPNELVSFSARIRVTNDGAGYLSLDTPDGTSATSITETVPSAVSSSVPSAFYPRTVPTTSGMTSSTLVNEPSSSSSALPNNPHGKAKMSESFPKSLPKIIPTPKDETGRNRPRTLVLCFDGTGDHLGAENSNLIEFFTLLQKYDPTQQMVYYQAGIGAYTVPQVATPFWTNVSKAVDVALGWNLDVHVMDGYVFMMQNYQANDKICIFGFSRGAYTARSLAGMVNKVGLLPADNHHQVPFAYMMYTRTDDVGWEQSVAFKKAFSIDVKIEFVGVWDTVNSVGLIHPRRLPFVSNNTAIRYFRHAVSLDERRARFKANLYNRPTKRENGLGVKEGEMDSPRVSLGELDDGEGEEGGEEKRESVGEEIVHRVLTIGELINGLSSPSSTTFGGVGLKKRFGGAKAKADGDNDQTKDTDTKWTKPVKTKPKPKPKKTKAQKKKKTVDSDSDENDARHEVLLYSGDDDDDDDEYVGKDYVTEDEYVCEDGGVKAERRDREGEKGRRKEVPETDVLEVWFAGCHCDIGGGSVKNGTRHNLARIPLRWMIRECFKANTGIRFHTSLLKQVGLDPESLYPIVKERPGALFVDESHGVGVRGGGGGGDVAVVTEERTVDIERVIPQRGEESAEGHTSLSSLTPLVLSPASSPLPRNPTEVRAYLDKLATAPHGALTEEEEDLADALCPIYDQLDIAKVWWILEVVPLVQRYQKPGVEGWTDRVMINRGRGRDIPEPSLSEELRVHRTVDIRMKATGYVQDRKGDLNVGKPYVPKARYKASPSWVD